MSEFKVKVAKIKTGNSVIGQCIIRGISLYLLATKSFRNFFYFILKPLRLNRCLYSPHHRIFFWKRWRLAYSCILDMELIKNSILWKWISQLDYTHYNSIFFSIAHAPHQLVKSTFLQSLLEAWISLKNSYLKILSLFHLIIHLATVVFSFLSFRKIF